MSMLASFLKNGDTELGVFYPKNYLLAVFADLPQAQKAEKELQSAGVPKDEVISVSGADMIRYASENEREHGLWGSLMREVSRLLATEAVYTDRDQKMASHGAGFLLVHVPGDQPKREIWALLEPLHPLVARHYGVDGIDHLLGEV